MRNGHMGCPSPVNRHTTSLVGGKNGFGTYILALTIPIRSVEKLQSSTQSLN